MENARHNARSLAKLSLLLLALQNAASLTLLPILENGRDGNDQRSFDLVGATTISEALKLLLAVAAIAASSDDGKSSSLSRELSDGHFQAALAAGSCTLAIMCQSAAAKSLTVVSFVVMSQVKVLLYPCFATAFLGQTFTRHHWMCLLLMASGICVIQQSLASVARKGAESTTFYGLGLMVASGAAVSMSGVCVEASMKRPKRFWVLQAQLSTYTFIAAIGVLLYRERVHMIAQLMQRMSPLGWVFVVLQVMGGPLVGWCVRLTNTSSKIYAQGLGFLLATSSGLYMSPSTKPIGFYIGVAFLVGSLFWYATIATQRDFRAKIDHDIRPEPWVADEEKAEETQIRKS